MVGRLQSSSSLPEQIKGLANDLGSEISQTILNIEEISDGIQILSINAKIEAARAGKAGLGFKVVADHVQALW